VTELYYRRFGDWRTEPISWRGSTLIHGHTAAARHQLTLIDERFTCVTDGQTDGQFTGEVGSLYVTCSNTRLYYTKTIIRFSYRW